jgi:hypothetical protein
MRSAFLTLAAAVIGLLLQGQPAAAQFNAFGNMGGTRQVGPVLPPAVSPYLNLTMGAGPVGYQLRTLPEFQREAFESAVLQGWPSLGSYGTQPPLGQEFPVLGQTGHLTAFGAYGTYYNYPAAQQRPYYPLNPNQARSLPQ